jgi:hypothetical protein
MEGVAEHVREVTTDLTLGTQIYITFLALEASTVIGIRHLPQQTKPSFPHRVSDAAAFRATCTKLPSSGDDSS